jgi:hypothetical protein
VAVRQIAKGVDFLASAAAQNPAAQEEEGDIRTQAGPTSEPGLEVEPVSAQMLQSHEGRRSIAARPTQATARRDLLLQPNLDSALGLSSAPPELASLVHQVASAGRDCGVSTFHMHTARPRRELNLQVIVQVDGLIKGSDFVVAIWTLPKDSQPEIDLGKGLKRNGVFHEGRERGKS